MKGEIRGKWKERNRRMGIRGLGRARKRKKMRDRNRKNRGSIN